MYQHPKLKVYLVVLFLFPALATFASIHLVAQEKRRTPLPLSEMQRVSKLYVGRWEYTATYPKSAFSPIGGVNTGVLTSVPSSLFTVRNPDILNLGGVFQKPAAFGLF